MPKNIFSLSGKKRKENTLQHQSIYTLQLLWKNSNKGRICVNHVCIGRNLWQNICDGRLEFRIIFIPSANCSSSEQLLLPSLVTCFLTGYFICLLLFDCRLQEKLKQKRLEREEQEKKEQIAREKLRRAHGKDMTSTKEK